jgi:hypothetical protein
VECILTTLRAMARGQQASLYSARQIQLLEQAYIALQWPWDQLNLSANALKHGQCQTWAESLANSIGGEIIHIVPSPNLGTQFLGDVFTLSGERIEGWTEHFAVRKGGMIFDRITGPNGLSIQDYKNLFKYSESLVGW